MKICLVTEEYIPPVKRFSLTLKLAETLGEKHEVHLVGINFDPSYRPKNFIFHPIKLPKHDEFDLYQRIVANLKLTKKVSSVCKKHDIDIIYGWWPVAYWASMLSGRPFASDMPEFIEVMYESYKKGFQFFMKPALKTFQTIVAKKSRKIMTESVEAIRKWEKRGVDSRKLEAMPYGIEVDFFVSHENGKVRERFGIPTGERIVMFHGDIGIDDGIDILLKAVRGLDVWCVIVGDGPKDYVSYLKKIAGKKTIFTGWVDYQKIPAYLSACDLYVAPFRSSKYTNTTHPIKQMEAMAAGKAVVCSRIRAFSETVEDGHDIVLVRPGDVGELRSTIKGLIANANWRERLGRNAKKTANLKFRWETRVEKDIEMLEGIFEN